MKITLRELDALPFADPRFMPSSIERGRQALVNRNLRYDTTTAIVRDNNGWLERPVSPDDRPAFTNAREVLDKVFARYIRNAASRLERGYSA